MITFEEAFDIVQNAANFTYPSEQIDFINSLGRILAMDVFSDMHMPPFDKSAMDGYACRKEDLKNSLEVIEVFPPEKS